MWACRPTPPAVSGLRCTRKACGRAMRAPMANGTIEPRYELETGSGRPYRPPLRGSRRRVRRGGFYIRPMPPRRMHLRRTHAPTANGTNEPRYELETGSGRPYRPPLRGSRRRVRRGGFYIRPMLPRRMHLRRTHAPTANGTIEPRRESGTGLYNRPRHRSGS